MKATVHKKCSLFCKEGTSDKEYNIFIEDSLANPGTFDVYATWGRRGSPSASQYKAHGVSLPEAVAVLISLKREKEAKRYRENPSLSGGTPFTTVSGSDSKAEAKPERELTELKPQLLNPIGVEEMEQYITSDEWLAQEKLDGKRIMVEVNFGHVTASNRRSWKVSIPSDIAEELSKFDDCILDGELVRDVYYVFDCLNHNGEDLRTDSYLNRFNRLVEDVIGDRMLYQVDIVPTAYSTSAKRALIQSLEHKEGVVFKNLSAPHEVGRPIKNGSQLKCKFWSSATCVVTSVNIKRSVGVSVDSPDGFVPVGNVTVPPNYELPNVGDYVEVKYLYFNPGGALYQPQYLGVRDDVEIDLLSSLKPKSDDTDE